MSFTLISYICCVPLNLQKLTQRAKSRGICGESSGIVVVGGGNPHGNLGCKWNENPRGNSGEIFKLGLKWAGSFPKPVNILIHQRMTSNHYWDISTYLGPFLCHWIAFWNFWGRYEGNFHAGISQGFPQRKEAETSTLKIPFHFPWISARKSWGHFRRDDPWNSPIIRMEIMEIIF